MEMNRTSWLILAIATLFLGLITLYFKLANPLTPVSTSPTTTESVTGEPNTPSGWRVISRGQINVKDRFADAGSYSGRVLIQVWGKATVDSTQAPLSPRGETKGVRADSRFPLPNAPLFCAILKANGETMFVGDMNEFNFPRNTVLSLGTNDDEKSERGLGFEDNYGFWNYKISVPN